MNVKMNLLCLACCFTVAIAASIMHSMDEEWEQYKINFHKIYHPNEEVIRRKHFERRMEIIHSHNERFARKEVSYKLGINQFTDMTDDEILKKNARSNVRYHVDDSMKSSYDQNMIQLTQVDEHCDWRVHGAVSGVKDQGDCNESDYAFAAVGALEGQLFRKDEKLTELSEQDLIDCSKTYGNNGCGGGDVGKAIEYVKRHGILTETSYSFKGEECETCPSQLRDGITNGTKIDCKPITARDEKQMRSIIFKEGPITAKIHISSSSKFLNYQTGIFTGDDCGEGEVNHYVLIVGYGVTDKSERYWIVKNSWGNTWGENGFARITRDKNTCGIAMEANYITIETDKREITCKK